MRVLIALLSPFLFLDQHQNESQFLEDRKGSTVDGDIDVAFNRYSHKITDLENGNNFCCKFSRKCIYNVNAYSTVTPIITTTTSIILT